MNPKLQKALPELLSKEFNLCGTKHTLLSAWEEVLNDLHREADCFSGKRAFGDDSWSWAFATLLIKENLIEGELNEDDFAETVVWSDYNQVIQSILKYCFSNIETLNATKNNGTIEKKFYLVDIHRKYESDPPMVLICTKHYKYRTDPYEENGDLWTYRGAIHLSCSYDEALNNLDNILAGIHLMELSALSGTRHTRVYEFTKRVKPFTSKYD